MGTKSKVLATGAVIVLLCIIVAGTMWFLGNSEVAARRQAIKAQGLPSTSAEINDYYAVPTDLPDATAEWVAVIQSLTGPQFNAKVADLPILGRGDDPPLPGMEWNQLDASRKFLATMSAELTAAHAAAATGGYVRFPIDFSMGFNTLLPDTQESRTVARLFMLEAYVSAHDGDYDQAYQDVQGMLATAEALHFEPTLISQLVRMAIRAMAINTIEELVSTSDWSDAQLADLQTKLAAADLKAGIKRALIGERAMGVGELKKLAIALFRSTNELEALDFYETLIASIDEPWSSAIKTSEQLADSVKGLSSSPFGKLKYSGVLLILPATEQVIIAGARSSARTRCVVVGLAIRRFELQEGKELESMDELSAKFFALPEGRSFEEMMTDPFDGQPIKTKGDTDHIAIYSVGPDLIDGQGDLGSEDSSMSDIGFRLHRKPVASR